MQFLNNLTLPSSSTCQDSLQRRRALVRKRNRNDRRIYFGKQVRMERDCEVPGVFYSKSLIAIERDFIPGYLNSNFPE
ncbi:hypothetical protein CEXT_250691 [Caerostris extrusa]|uniref:Uncharacterized protein n=1 Tax=Caerostris extrusa TaxID=172846 RepID=A0AAV4NYL9_CAEEX|nr:hypothetical protein CEXT_250691 [Caerostris extrusa]